MIFKIAWRSIWRNRRRTIITIGSISLGLTWAIFAVSIQSGVFGMMIDKVAGLQAGHVTLENPEYKDAPAIDLYVRGVSELVRKLEKLPSVRDVKLLVVGQGIAKSGAGGVAVGLMGVEPSIEAVSSELPGQIVDGEYLSDDDMRLVVIGREMADRLNLDVGKKLVISTNDVAGNLVDQLVRVKGIFKTGSAEMDGYFIQTPIRFARMLYQMPENTATRVGLILDSPDRIEQVVESAKKLVDRKAMAVRPWEDVMPELASFIRMKKGSTYIIMAMLFFLILFTIFNTILMSVLERNREFGVLIAIGTEPGQVKMQVFAETVLISLLGCAVGLAIGGGLAWYFQGHGIDVSGVMSEQMSISGYGAVTLIRSQVSFVILLVPAAIIFIATLLLSLIPLRRVDRIDLATVLRTE